MLTEEERTAFRRGCSRNECMTTGSGIVGFVARTIFLLDPVAYAGFRVGVVRLSTSLPFSLSGKYLIPHSTRNAK